MWNEFFANPFNLQYLCMGICIVILIVACNSYWNNETGVELFVNSLREKDKRRKDYLIIILGVLMVGLFLFSCGAYVNTMGEGETNGMGR
ncbi:hypothetical protein CMK13_06775 [Candidatus Poribacteria bacterium]|nr:hypothetical protein [Candidatus Poribacteria bacterium]OUT63481.1 MAG: hypothetical protein CBB75_06250 [bacterium TMED15]